MVAGTSKRLLALAVVAAALTGCQPTDTPVSAGGTTGTTAPASQPAPTATAASLCDLIIDINTSAGYMVNKTYAKGGPTAAQLEKIVNLVLLRKDELKAASDAAGLGDVSVAQQTFYRAMADAAAGDPGFYADYVAGDRAAVQRIADAVGDLKAFRAKQLALANYQKTHCGITIPTGA
jgi:hypothetical protein